MWSESGKVIKQLGMIIIEQFEQLRNLQPSWCSSLINDTYLSNLQPSWWNSLYNNTYLIAVDLFQISTHDWLVV